ncbi:replication endonuclease [Plesiomonas shigelloides]|uniref:replication endonuclease n=1 Tax=Plesiomonas shigelloides TaxID=703 RepID=UPI001E3BBEE0|nr:replication endonuclease [Plesiomonas shigelloides]
MAAKRDPDSGPVTELMALPDYLREPLLQHLNHLRQKQDAIHAEGKPSHMVSKFIQGKLSRLLQRIALIEGRFLTLPYQRVVVRERLDELLQLPQLSKRRLQTVATLTAGAFAGEFDRLYTKTIEEQTPELALAVYKKLARMAHALHITPPYWGALNSRSPNFDLLPGAFLRMMCAEWWQRKLWRLRCRWREEQLRAAGQVSRQTSPYISKDALITFREQRRRLREFLKTHELVNDEGFVIDLETVYYAGVSNPTHRRIEMMTTLFGMEMIAKERGDIATFITVTCPSRYHAMTSTGHPNPKWDGSTIRESSDYLVNHFFAAVRKRLNREKLRWYGARVAEPHHDGTVHWHMMMYSHPEERDAIESIVREIAIHEDRGELGNDITPRFKSELITADKGSPTAYIAAYIGKNLDRGAVNKNDPKTGLPRADHESGKSMADTVEHAVGWAGLHGVRQFQFFGIPSRQVWRELRRLASQMSRNPDAPKQLPDPAMDAVLASADAGCFASYIKYQGGVLVPRKDYVVRTAYALADKPNDYGETPIQIYGIYSPQLGERSRICTHLGNWTVVKKGQTLAPSQPAKAALALQGSSAAPWTNGNNCPTEQKVNNNAQHILIDKTQDELSRLGFDVSKSMVAAILNGAQLTDGEGKVVTYNRKGHYLDVRRTQASASAAVQRTDSLMARFKAAAQRKLAGQQKPEIA